MSQARTLAKGTREPYIAWSYLKRWATGKGPTAMKAAMVSFLEEHGSKPESAVIIPEIMRGSYMMPPSERKELMESANLAFSSIQGFNRGIPPVGRAIQSGTLPISGNRPAFSTVFKPKQSPSAPLSGVGERFTLSNENRAASLRDELSRISESVRQSYSVNPINAAPHKREDPRRIDPSMQVTHESFGHTAGAAKSHAIMHSLIERIRSHGMDAAQVQNTGKPAMKRPKPKIKATVSHTRRPAARNKPKKSTNRRIHTKAVRHRTVSAIRAGRKRKRG